MASKRSAHSKKPVKTIAITGISGFKGSRLLKALEESPDEYKIVAIDKKKPPFETRKTKFYKVDLIGTYADSQLADVFKQEKCDMVFHCAFPITPPKNEGLAHELISVGTFYLLNACAEAQIKKIVLASTSDVYGAFPSNPNFLQEDVHEPMGFRHSSFLADKIDAENQARHYAKKHPNCTVTILRPCTILGPTIQSYKTRLLRRAAVATILGFDPLVQFLHEEDLIRAFMLAVEKDCPGIYNIVGDGVLPISRVIEICGKYNVRLPQIGFKTMVQALWYLDISPAPASHVNFLRYLCIADGSKAQEKMGFVPRFSTKESLLSFMGAERLREVQLIGT